MLLSSGRACNQAPNYVMKAVCKNVVVVTARDNPKPTGFKNVLVAGGQNNGDPLGATGDRPARRLSAGVHDYVHMIGAAFDKFRFFSGQTARNFEFVDTHASVCSPPPRIFASGAF